MYFLDNLLVSKFEITGNLGASLGGLEEMLRKGRGAEVELDGRPRDGRRRDLPRIQLAGAAQAAAQARRAELAGAGTHQHSMLVVFISWSPSWLSSGLNLEYVHFQTSFLST